MKHLTIEFADKEITTLHIAVITYMNLLEGEYAAYGVCKAELEKVKALNEKIRSKVGFHY